MQAGMGRAKLPYRACMGCGEVKIDTVPKLGRLVGVGAADL
jgi:hypothetical protein